jgi:hypothetical protein
MDGLAPGRMVTYVLSDKDCREINRRRTTPEEIRTRIEAGTWPLGAQAHVGSVVVEGMPLPAMVISVIAQDTGCVNLKVELDGSDQFWAPERYYTAQGETGTWHWPARV